MVVRFLSDEFRLLLPRKSIWIYSGYTWEEIIGEYGENQIESLGNGYGRLTKRAQIVMNCDVLIDGQYIESQHNASLPWRGSENQRVIDIKKSLQKGEIVLWQT